PRVVCTWFSWPQERPSSFIRWVFAGKPDVERGLLPALGDKPSGSQVSARILESEHSNARENISGGIVAAGIVQMANQPTMAHHETKIKLIEDGDATGDVAQVYD